MTWHSFDRRRFRFGPCRKELTQGSKSPWRIRVRTISEVEQCPSARHDRTLTENRESNARSPICTKSLAIESKSTGKNRFWQLTKRARSKTCPTANAPGDGVRSIDYSTFRSRRSPPPICSTRSTELNSDNPVKEGRQAALQPPNESRFSSHLSKGGYVELRSEKTNQFHLKRHSAKSSHDLAWDSVDHYRLNRRSYAQLRESVICYLDGSCGVGSIVDPKPPRTSR